MADKPKPTTKQAVLRTLGATGRKSVLSDNERECIESILKQVSAMPSHSTRGSYYQFVVRLGEYFRVGEIDLIVQLAIKASLKNP